jgi:hypothetical protein
MPRDLKVDGGLILYVGITVLTVAVVVLAMDRKEVYTVLIGVTIYALFSSLHISCNELQVPFLLEPLGLKLLYRFLVYSLAFDKQSFLPATLDESSEPIPRRQYRMFIDRLTRQCCKENPYCPHLPLAFNCLHSHGYK